MFGSRKPQNNTNERNNSNSNNVSTSSSINAIGRGTKIKGEISSDQDIRVDGTIIGDLICKGKVVLGPEGRIDGTIHCDNAVFEGSFKGVLHVKQLLSIKQNANVDGEINTGKLNVEPGANFNVSCMMMTGDSAPSQHGKATPKSAPKKPEIKLKV